MLDIMIEKFKKFLMGIESIQAHITIPSEMIDMLENTYTIDSSLDPNVIERILKGSMGEETLDEIIRLQHIYLNGENYIRGVNYKNMLEAVKYGPDFLIKFRYKAIDETSEKIESSYVEFEENVFNVKYFEKVIIQRFSDYLEVSIIDNTFDKELEISAIKNELKRYAIQMIYESLFTDKELLQKEDLIYYLHSKQEYYKSFNRNSDAKMISDFLLFLEEHKEDKRW